MGLQEVMHGFDKEKDEIMAMDPLEVMARMNKAVSQYSVPANWETFRMTPTAQQQLQEINTKRKNNTRRASSRLTRTRQS